MTLPENQNLAANASPRIPELDGVRGIAIFLVVIWHYVVSKVDPQSSLLADFISRSLPLTWSGVDLFFVLSGFLIGGILLDHKQAPRYFKAFYARRICRIFPLYFSWLLLFVVLILAARGFTSTAPFKSLFENPLPLWSYATFTQNFAMTWSETSGPHWLGITWSLAIEEQFYLVLPLIVRIVPLARLPYLLTTIIAATPILRFFLSLALPAPTSTYATYTLMPTRADSLLLGVLCAYAVRQKDTLLRLREHTRLLYGVLLILLLGSLVLTVLYPTTTTLGMAIFGYTWLALLYSCFLLIAVTEKRGFVTNLTRNPLLRQMGILAYGMYIFHQAFSSLAHGLILQQTPQLRTLPDLLVTLAAFVLTLLTASISWNLMEKKFVAIGHSVRYEEQVQRSAAQFSMGDRASAGEQINQGRDSLDLSDQGNRPEPGR